jgi:Pentapeptide repeats (8 copies)
VAIAVALAIGGDAAAVQAAPRPTKRLQEQKLREEVRQLRIQNDRAGSLREELLAWAPFITVLVGVFGVVLPVVHEVRQQRDQRAAELEQRRLEEERRLEQRAAELEQRRIEERRRFDSLFAQAVADLGSSRESVQVSAAIALQSFLRAEYNEFHPQIHAVLCANLAIEHSPLVGRFIVRAFQDSIRLHLGWRRQQSDPTPLDLANCQMPRVDLEGLDLGERADIAFASFRRANLRSVRLFRAEGYEAILDGAHLSRANRVVRPHTLS